MEEAYDGSGPSNAETARVVNYTHVVHTARKPLRYAAQGGMLAIGLGGKGKRGNGPMHRSNGLQIDEDLQRLIDEIAQARGISPADVVRAAVEEYSAPTQWPETWLERAERLGLIGCCEHGPTDRSTNKAYFEGFGGD